MPVYWIVAMCGRYALWGIDLLGVRFLIVDPSIGFRSHFNIGPGTENPAIVSSSNGNHIMKMTWGLVPSWAKDPKNAPKPINARSESLAEKPAFKDLLLRKRCIIPANGFFEWKTVHTKKEPYFVSLKERDLFGFAGLFDTWTGPAGTMTTYTIVTTEANKTVARYHSRMPVILRKEFEDSWVSSSPLAAGELNMIFTPYPEEELIACAVSSAVNSTVAEGEDLVHPISAQSMLTGK